MSGPGGDTPHPMADPNFRDSRTLYLTDWATLVQPDQIAAHRFVTHSVTYGSTGLQAAYLLNGGALAALPALLTSLTAAGAAAIATAAIPFIAGISLAAISSLAAYLNFQWHAQIAWHDSSKTAAMLGRFYQNSGTDPDPQVRMTYENRVKASLLIGVTAAILSLVAFIWGSWSFIELARHSAKPAIFHPVVPPRSLAPAAKPT